MSGAVVGTERRACGRLRVAEFFKGGKNGAGVLAANINSTGFGFGSGRDDIFDGLAEYVEGAIDTVIVGPTEVVVGGGTAASFGLDEVGGIGGSFENHVAGMVADDGIGICV